ncbi:hypothetical protein AVEN_272566-1 [Araneus ventricosus]|uniref:RNase H type-1 domain-containing protein n=1 Tax=Araneus ventricosus TaxID=182803 RepID=A0A4Y2VPE2_ARAVE|nr:hypothetical protein AVEN_272566-1 [Araneus ventricosus]
MIGKISTNHEPIPLDLNGDKNTYVNIPIQEERKAIQKTRNTSPGADCIPAKWFKKLSIVHLLKLTGFFQEICSSTDIPEQWKHSVIVPVPKPNKDKSKINSYRPIALTSVCSKIFERILVQRITHHLIVNKKIPSYIYGFLPLRDNQLAIYGINIAITEAHHQKKLSESIWKSKVRTTLAVGKSWHPYSFKKQNRLSLLLRPPNPTEGTRIDPITSDHIITLPNILDVLHKDICEIHLASFGFQDKAQPTFMIKALFEETISEEFQDYFIIATDASKSHIYTSIAGTSNLRSFPFRIHPINSIFTAEALAIFQAIDDLSVPDSDLLILTDSFSVLQTLKNLSIKSPKVILRLAHKILMRTKFHQKIALVWTPGHSNITWIERTYSLAKNVTDSNLYIEWIAVEDICSYYSNLSIQKPIENFRNSKYLEILGDLLSILSLAPWLKNRHEDIIITRILTRMIITPALLHRFGLHNNPFCSVCNQENTIEHILLICKKYLPHRRIFWLKLNLNLQIFSSYKVFLHTICSSKRHLQVFLQMMKLFDIY